MRMTLTSDMMTLFVRIVNERIINYYWFKWEEIEGNTFPKFNTVLFQNYKQKFHE